MNPAETIIDLAEYQFVLIDKIFKYLTKLKGLFTHLKKLKGLFTHLKNIKGVIHTFVQIKGTIHTFDKMYKFNGILLKLINSI